MIRPRKPYPSDVSDEEWSLVAPYLALMREDPSQREHPLRELFNGLRYVIRYGIAWRAMPNNLPPKAAGLPAIAALAGGGLLGARLSRRIARGCGPHGRADSRDPLQPDPALDLGKRPARRL
jgi:transposase